MTEGPFTGGCRCGAIRYEIDRVFDVIYCHCTKCRPLTVSAAVAGDSFRITRGAPRAYSTSASGSHHFCEVCGSGLYGEYVEPGHPLARDGRYFSVNVGSVDDPEKVRPQIHQFVESKLSWLNIDDELLQVEGNKLPHPDKRNISSTTRRKQQTREINENLIEQIHGAFASGQHPPTNLFAPDVVWHVEGNNPLARNYTGRDAVFAAFRSDELHSGGTLSVRLMSVTANQEYALAVLHATGDRAGQSYECFEYDVYRILNGAVAEFWSFSSNQSATDGFWS